MILLHVLQEFDLMSRINPTFVYEIDKKLKYRLSYVYATKRRI